MADAEAAARDLNLAGTTHVRLEGRARFLLRTESVASARTEGLAIHRTLMPQSAHPGVGGQVRTEQYWIGGSAGNPCRPERRPERAVAISRGRG